MTGANNTGREYKKGKRSVLIPVHVAEVVAVAVPRAKQECSVVIEARSVRVTVNGCIDAAVICTVLERLAGSFRHHLEHGSGLQQASLICAEASLV
jgi:hypothetical protein